MKTRLLRRLRKEANRTYRSILDTREYAQGWKGQEMYRNIVKIGGYMFEFSNPYPMYSQEEMKKEAIRYGIDTYVRIKKYGHP